MVAFFIFLLHAIAFGYAFVTRKKAGGLSEGLLSLAFMGIVFAVGWTISTMLTNLLFTPDFFIRWYYQHTDSYFLRILRQEISRDTISLLFLTFGEVGFYYLYLGDEASHRNDDAGAPQEKPPANA
jgi:hypothetical protein